MEAQEHWEGLYGTKTPEETSWFKPHLQTSFDWISAATEHKSVSIIDVGTGESTLIDDLLAAGYRDITVLDIAWTATRSFRNAWGRWRSRSFGWLAT
ncbi:hypothetical protein HDF16_005585 [Granulicella aggregans]|uniref:Methyltransferase family protein n=1 Tax=Granulicella aggregans TaxID=474949 RepID=A0A7W7ZJ31_9BACT|nr:hypothetical protein [Granulicella aggregans]MBB5060849.1 hypothetical protein [Granulicella aggregans]